jgi:hypothetical protein
MIITFQVIYALSLSISAEKYKNIDIIFNLMIFTPHREIGLFGIALTALSFQLSAKIVKKLGVS